MVEQENPLRSFVEENEFLYESLSELSRICSLYKNQNQFLTNILIDLKNEYNQVVGRLVK